MGNQPKWRCKQEWWDIDGCTISGIYSRLDVMYFEAFWKKGLNPERYCHFNRENNDSPVDGIGFPISRHCWTQPRMVQYCFLLFCRGCEYIWSGSGMFGPASQRKSGASSLGVLLPAQKELGPKTIKKRHNFLGTSRIKLKWSIPTWVIDVMSIMSIMSNMSIMSMIVSITRSCYEDGVKATLPCVSRQQRLGAPGFFEIGIV